MRLWEKALETFNLAEKLKPNNHRVLTAIAKALRQLNRMEELEQLYLRMYELFPEDHTLAMYLGKIAFDSGRAGEGLSYYKKAVKIDSESLIGWMVLSEALAKLGRTEEAQAAHDKHKEIEDRLKRDNTQLQG